MAEEGEGASGFVVAGLDQVDQGTGPRDHGGAQAGRRQAQAGRRRARKLRQDARLAETAFLLDRAQRSKDLKARRACLISAAARTAQAFACAVGLALPSLTAEAQDDRTTCERSNGELAIAACTSAIDS